ncbi:MAG: hypothetical protein ABH811_00505 [archaeon]
MKLKKVDFYKGVKDDFADLLINHEVRVRNALKKNLEKLAFIRDFHKGWVIGIISDIEDIFVYTMKDTEGKSLSLHYNDMSSFYLVS